MLVPLLTIFAAIGLVFVVAERLDPAHPQLILRRGLFTDGIYCAVSIAIRIIVNGTLAIAVSRLGSEALPGHAIGLLRDHPVWAQSVAVIFVLDLVFYVIHRLKHRWRWWWRLHETHHSSRDLDWFSSVRFHPLEKLLDRTLYLVPLLFLGVSEQALLVLAALDALIASFSHSNLNWRIGPLIYVFVGPEMHRWHHSRDPRRQNCNFGNNLSIFDWAFGTAYISPENPAAFGVSDPNYPEGSFPKQFLYAFRSFGPRPALRPPAPAMASARPGA